MPSSLVTDGASAPVEGRPGSEPRATFDQAELEARALAGHQSAWDALIARHHRRVVVTLVARGVPLDRAQDIANEAWMRLVERQREGRLAELDLPGLAIRQASFLALEEGRRERARRAAPLDGDDAIDPGADPERHVLSREALRRAQEVLAACSPTARDAFRLVYAAGGVTHAEAAEKLGLSEQRVRQILCEIRQKMRSSIQDGSHDD